MEGGEEEVFEDFMKKYIKHAGTITALIVAVVTIISNRVESACENKFNASKEILKFGN